MYPYVFLTLRRSSEYETESGWAGGRAIFVFFCALGARSEARSVGRTEADRPTELAGQLPTGSSCEGGRSPGVRREEEESAETLGADVGPLIVV